MSVKAPPGLWQFGRSSNSSRTSLGVAKWNCDFTLTPYTKFWRYLGQVISLGCGQSSRAQHQQCLCQRCLWLFDLAMREKDIFFLSWEPVKILRRGSWCPASMAVLLIIWRFLKLKASQVTLVRRRGHSNEERVVFWGGGCCLPAGL